MIHSAVTVQISDGMLKSKNFPGLVFSLDKNNGLKTSGNCRDGLIVGLKLIKYVIICG